VTALRAARADVAAQVVAALADPTVTVLAYDPPSGSGDMVTVSTAGIGTLEWRLNIRVYVPDVQSEEGQDRLDDLAETVDAGVGLARSEWSFLFDDRKGTFLMATVVDYPREDL
jgi:hypothetical protein